MTDIAKNTHTIAHAQTKSKKRIAEHGEVFTAEREVNAMLDLLPLTIHQDIEATFLEPACGTGNFLAEILRRKLAVALIKSQLNKSQKSPKYSQSHYERYAIQAISAIYGIELLADNVVECRERLHTLFAEHYQANFKTTHLAVLDVAKFLLSKNIVHGNALSLKTIQDDGSDGEPIIFSEWKFIGDTQIKRREFVYENLVEKTDNASPIDAGFIAKSIQDYPPIYFLQLHKQNKQTLEHMP